MSWVGDGREGRRGKVSFREVRLWCPGCVEVQLAVDLPVWVSGSSVAQQCMEGFGELAHVGIRSDRPHGIEGSENMHRKQCYRTG